MSAACQRIMTILTGISRSISAQLLKEVSA
ncbi:hypothetical protein A4R44_05679 [Amycolatopsis sp. M39]|nr:hypothetical protein A4R44_05679 [Amycolatopsis sp. M39]